MTAGGTYRGPRAGETVGTAAELDALPIGSVVRDSHGSVHVSSDEALGDPVWMEAGSVNWHQALTLAIRGPLTVLFRPDAPQPATTDDAVERAVEIIWPTSEGEWPRAEGVYSVATKVLALAAAGAGVGEAEPSPLCDCGEPKNGHSHPSGEALARVIAGAVYGDPENLSRATEATDAVLALLAARGDTAPTEVEWGVLVDIDTIVPARSSEHAAKIARLHEHQGRNPQIIQRTVFTWREVR